MIRATDSGRSPRASLRATSTLLLAAQLLALGHLLIVHHTICPEHGETIHSGLPSQAQALPAPPQRATSDAGLTAHGTPPAEDAHDHCLTGANTRERFALLPFLDVAPGPLLLAAPLPSRTSAAVAPALAVLRLAPKNSPPSA
jgi:hypothetical protein